VIDMITPGSGGFGVPARRAPAAIGRDLLDGYVTADGATRDYGVANPDELQGRAKAED
jgi:N-methylhydantoinase B